jgi:heavy metal sensor kinase
VVGGFAAIVFVRARSMARESLEENLRVRAGTVASFVEIDEEGLSTEVPLEKMPEFARPSSGAYFAVYDAAGRPLNSSPSMLNGRLPPPPPWDDREVRFGRVAEGPAGEPLATAVLSFLARVDPPEAGARGGKVLDRRFTVQVGMSTRERDEDLASLAGFLCLAGGLGILLSLAAGLLVSGRLLRPLRRMTEEAALLTPEDEGRRLDPGTVVAELHSLATTLNSALDRLADALRRQRRLAADASHELRTPVAVLLGNAEVLLRRPRTEEELREGLERQVRTAKRMAAIIENLLALARADAGRAPLVRRPVALAALARTICGDFGVLAGEAGVRFSCTGDEGAVVAGDPSALGQVLENLLSNALRYAPRGSTVEVAVAGEGDAVVLSVYDTGPGIPPEHRGHVFERFYRVETGRSAESGAGLGLAIVRSIVEAHGGTVAAGGEAGKGAVFTVRLPSAAIAGAADPAS